MNPYIAIILGGIIFGTYFVVKTERRNAAKAESKFQEEFVKYRKKLEEQNIPKTAAIVQHTHHHEHDNCDTYSSYFWREDGKIYFFPVIESQENLNWYCVDQDDAAQFDPIIIPIESIDYFYKMGEVYRETKVSGGGSSMKGAAAGKVLAGDTGAIIGSRKGIRSETITHDTRAVSLLYRDNSGENKELSFDDGAYHIFQRVIPEKNFDVVTAQKAQSVKQENKIADKLKQLDELRKEGILTEKEFENKKKSLLDQL